MRAGGHAIRFLLSAYQGLGKGPNGAKKAGLGANRSAHDLTREGDEVVTFLLFFQLGLGAAPQISDPSTLTSLYEALQPQWMARVMPYAQDLFWSLALVDMGVFGWSLMRRHGHNIQGAILSTANQLVILGAFLSLLQNGSVWMGYVVNMFIDVGKAGSGVPLIQPSVVLGKGISIAFALLGQSVLAGLTADPLTAIAMVIAALCIVAAFTFITIEFVVTKVQTFLALGMGMFFLGFGGSSWTRNYVERYFSYAVSSGVRLMTSYFLIGAGIVLGDSWLKQANSSPWSLAGVKSAWIIMIGAVMFAAISWKGAAMAAQLLGGGPNLSHNEVFHAMGAAVQGGVAAALIASGIGSAVAGATGASAASSGAGAATGGAAAATGGGSTPPSRPPSSGSGGGSQGPSVYQAAGATVSAMYSAGGGGSHQVHPPTMGGLNGHGHD
jgi:type IV secretion system protein TrbL